MAIHLTPALTAKLQQIAAETNSSASEITEKAMKAFAAEYEEIRDAVAETDAQFERGELLPNEEVVVRIDALRGGRQKLIAAVHEGIAAGERGEIVEHHEVTAMLDKIIAHG